jgi:CheY-like chemotaxis protein
MSKVKQVRVVEDELIVADDLRKRLTRMGYNVPVAVSSGKEAIEKANENLPDLVLMDIVLHGDINKIKAAEKIHSSLDIPVIYLTAYANKKTLQHARITEPYGYIIKPFKERELQINLEIALTNMIWKRD